MAATRSTVIARHVSSVGDVIIGVVPSNETWLLKSLDISNTSGGTASLTIYAQAGPPSTVAGYLIQTSTLAAGVRPTSSHWMALIPGDQLRLYCSVAGVHVWISGAVLPGSSSHVPAAESPGTRPA